MRPITFPRSGDGEWANSETGVRIVRARPDARRGYEIRMPMLNAVGWQHSSYAANHDEARRSATLAVKVFRSELATAYVAACREDTERMATAEDDSLVHLWNGTRDPARCGVAVWSTPYTFGSPEVAAVTCKSCLLEM